DGRDPPQVGCCRAARGGPGPRWPQLFGAGPCGLRLTPREAPTACGEGLESFSEGLLPPGPPPPRGARRGGGAPHMAAPERLLGRGRRGPRRGRGGARPLARWARRLLAETRGPLPGPGGHPWQHPAEAPARHGRCPPTARRVRAGAGAGAGAAVWGSRTGTCSSRIVNDMRKDTFLQEIITKVVRNYGPKAFTALDWWPPDGMATEHFGSLSTHTLERYLVSIPQATAAARAAASAFKKKEVEIEWFECDPDLGERLLDLPPTPSTSRCCRRGTGRCRWARRATCACSWRPPACSGRRVPSSRALPESYEVLPPTATEFFEESTADRCEDRDLGLVGSVFFKRDRTKGRRRAAPRAKRAPKRRPPAPRADDDRVSLDDLNAALF
ncbi:unnamed protein product, partial [Prorocentrum cordatum]